MGARGCMYQIKSFIKRSGIYIDLGTENTLIYSRGQGWIINEPSFVTFRQKSHSHHIVAIGKVAKSHLGRTPTNIEVERPLHGGVIANFYSTEIMLKKFLDLLKEKIFLIQPEMIISLPCKVTEYERRAVEEVGRAVGGKSVRLIDEPMAAAIGAGLPITEARGQIVVDIGGGTTEIAVISLAGVVYSNAVRTGGHAMDQCIQQHLRSHFNLLIGEATAEKLKINFADALEDSCQKFEFKAVDLNSGLPKLMSLPKKEIRTAIEPVLQEIISAIKVALAKTPPELSADVVENGIWLTGGGALIPNLTTRVGQATGLKVNIAKDPLYSVARGGAYLLEHPELLEKVGS